jgi:large subunit ribosomal protein L4
MSMNETKTLKVLGTDGKPGKAAVELPGDIFDTQTNIPLIHQVVTAQLAAARQGTHATKTRGQVSGGGAKPWRQKGTGRARQGSRRAPQWTGGGTVHGPQPRSYAQRTPKRMITAALHGLLSDRAREDRIFVLESIVKGDPPSTKDAAKGLNGLGEFARLLVVLDREDFIGWLSVRNINHAHLIAVDQLNASDAVVADAIVFTKAALDEFTSRYDFDEAALAVEEPETEAEEIEEATEEAVEAEAPAEAEADEAAEAEEAEVDEAEEADEKQEDEK